MGGDTTAPHATHMSEDVGTIYPRVSLNKQLVYKHLGRVFNICR